MPDHRLNKKRSDFVLGDADDLLFLVVSPPSIVSKGRNSLRQKGAFGSIERVLKTIHLLTNDGCDWKTEEGRLES